MVRAFPFCSATLKQTQDAGGEQMAFYLGPDLGDLLVITLNKCVNPRLSLCATTLNMSQRRRSYARSHSIAKMPVSSFTVVKIRA